MTVTVSPRLFEGFQHAEGQIEAGATQRVQKRALAQPLGRGIDELVVAARHTLHASGQFTLAERAVDEGRRHAARSKRVDLILHQRNQWRHNQRHAVGA